MYINRALFLYIRKATRVEQSVRPAVATSCVVPQEGREADESPSLSRGTISGALSSPSTRTCCTQADRRRRPFAALRLYLIDFFFSVPSSFCSKCQQKAGRERMCFCGLRACCSIVPPRASYLVLGDGASVGARLRSSIPTTALYLMSLTMLFFPG